MAALGGMVVPAVIFLAFNAGGDGAQGWGIPMATDIAFALGVVALLGSRVPPAVKVLLLTLAIVDDIGAIVVIAVFYTDRVEFKFVLAAVLITAGVVLMHRARVVYPPVIAIAGFALWLAVYESGIHATIAGVVMGLLTPARPIQSELEAEELVNVLENDDDIRADEVRATARWIRGSCLRATASIDGLHPWTSYLIVPVFAANAGIVLSADSITLHRPWSAGSRSRSWSASSSASPCSAGSRCARIRTTPDGARWGHIMGWALSPASGSQCRCSSPAWPSTISTSKTTPRSASSQPRSSLQSSARIFASRALRSQAGTDNK